MHDPDGSGCACQPATEATALYRLSNDPNACLRGRVFVAEHLQQCGISDEDVQAATVVASELVSNALRHAAPPLCLQVAVDSDRIRVEVHDSSTAPPEPRNPTADQTNGRGLWLVGSLATNWGHRPNAPGKVVWAELPHTAGEAAP